MLSVLITFLILGFIIVIHEWGHFIVAKKSGVFVEEFAVGMGPMLWGKEKDGTLYSIRLFPLGGYCKMKDEDGDGANDPDSFNNATMFKKFLIVFAGAFMNFVLAISIFFIINLFAITETTTISNTIEGYPAFEAGITAGDVIYSVDGSRTRSFQDVSYIVTGFTGDNLEVVVNRDGQKLLFNLTPMFNEASGRTLIGIYPEFKSGLLSESQEGLEKNTLFETIRDSFWDMVFSIRVTLLSLVELVTGKLGMEQLTGPIGLAPVVNEQYENAMAVSFWSMLLTMLNIMGLLSANIGVFNLLPIPALDGGRIVFMLVEVITKKPISPEKEGKVHFIGFMLLMAFGIFVAFKDVMNIFAG